MSARRALAELLKAYGELLRAVRAPLDEASRSLEEALRDAISEALGRQVMDLGAGGESPLAALARSRLLDGEDPLSILYPGFSRPDLEELRRRIYSHFER